ncbi:hypothetical protein FKM82_024487 [Ascaphus truei]
MRRGTPDSAQVAEHFIVALRFLPVPISAGRDSHILLKHHNLQNKCLGRKLPAPHRLIKAEVKESWYWAPLLLYLQISTSTCFKEKMMLQSLLVVLNLECLWVVRTMHYIRQYEHDLYRVLSES